MKVGSIHKRQDRKEAAKLVAKGKVVGIFNRGVCALWFDGGNQKAIKKIVQIKGEKRKMKAISLTLSLKEFIPMIDLTLLPEEVVNFLKSSDLKRKIGSLLFIRAPIKKEFQNLIPNHAKTLNEEGVCMVQNWDSHGHTSTENFLRELRDLGVVHPAVTSMNESEKAEIVDQKLGEKFCQDKKIGIFLKDPKAHPKHKGSYTIISLDKDGVRLQRDGNIPGWIIELILGMPLIRDNTKKTKYSQLKFPKKVLQNLPSHKIREEVLQYLKA